MSFYCIYEAFSCSLLLLVIIDIKTPITINIQPIYPLKPRFSLKNIIPPNVPNTISDPKIRAACDGIASLCATACKVYAIPTDPKPPYKIGITMFALYCYFA